MPFYYDLDKCPRFRFGLTEPKEPETPNEDYFQCSERLHVYAVCDGATISYDSALWSRILARRYCRDQAVNRDWLLASIREFNARHDRDSLAWAQQAAFDRGSFSSLLGIVLDPLALKVRITAVGDSIAFLWDGKRLVCSFPYDRPEQFDANPTLLSTNLDLNVFSQEGAISSLNAEWDLAEIETPTITCMTDALSKWVLELTGIEPDLPKRLQALSSRKAFRTFVAEERAAGRLRKDDTTILALW